MAIGNARRLYNPFPRQPRGLQFVPGHLHFDPRELTSRRLAAGKHFLVAWDATPGVLTVHHRRNPDRALWATPGRHGHAFVAAASGESMVHESRGSYSLHDDVTLVFSHQTIENITKGSGSGSKSKHPAHACNDSGRSICLGRGEKTPDLDPQVDPDETVLSDDDDDDSAVVVVTGCLYSTCELASDELRQYNNENRRGDAESLFHEAKVEIDERRDASRVGVRYRLIFSERRAHQLGFALELDPPVRKNADAARAKRFNTDFFADSFHEWRRSSTLSMRSSSRSRRLKESDWRPDWRRNAREWSSFRCPRAERLNVGRVGPSSEDENERATLVVPRLNRVLLSYASHGGERFFGFGEQFSCFDMKGKRVPILVQEQGLGRGDQPITAAANLVAYRAGGDWHTTYAPAPHYLTSDMNSLFLEGYEHTVFDLTQRDCVQVQVHAGGMKGRILHGDTPAELIKEYTAAVGRMRALPAWITKGAIVGMQGGHEAVHDVWRKVREYDVPLSAFWLQDWVGQRKTSVGWQLWWNWEVDREHYPRWEALVAELKSCGVRTMAYLNPFIVSTEEKPNRVIQEDLFTVAVQEGYVVPDTCGAPCMLPITSFDAAMLDLTNPETRRWFKRLMHAMVQTGVRGWMADFGESLPFNSCVHSGEHPATAHNRYPELWAQLNREFVDEWQQQRRAAEKQEPTVESQPRDSKAAQQETAENLSCREDEGDEGDGDDDGDELVFFMRAGYRGSPRWATLFWAGDQMVSWQRNDGIKSAVTGLLSSGVSGFAFNHSDIGGYCTVDLPFLRYRRTEELLLRWMELNAFTVIFRSHEGNIPSANAQLYSNDTTLRHFARCAKIYKAWEFYRRHLVKEAAAVGMPVVRHLFLHYPQDQHVQGLVYQQFLVGSEILVIPVLDKGHTQVQAYFPSGDMWEHIWTGNLYQAPSKQHGLQVWVQAPIGFPAVFVKQGSWVGQQFMHNLVKEKLKTS